MANEPRRSARKRQKTTSLLEDFETAMKDVLGDSGSEKEKVPRKRHGKTTVDSDDDFAVQDRQVLAADGDGDRDLTDSEDDNGASDVERDDEFDVTDSVGGIAKRSNRARPTRRVAATQKKKRITLRDLNQFLEGRQDRYLGLTKTEDLISFVKVRDKWITNLALPSRTVDNLGRGGMAHDLYEPEAFREAESIQDWDWYFDHGGQERFAAVTSTRSCSESEALPYLCSTPNDHFELLMGPWKTQKTFTLARGDVLNIPASFDQATEQLDPLADGMSIDEPGDRDLGPMSTRNEPPAATSNQDPSPTSNAPQSVSTRTIIHRPRLKRTARTGWVLNLLCNIDCLEWAPNRDDPIQYLAIATHPQTTLTGPRTTTAFEPSPPSRASIQIWAFSSLTNADEVGLMDNNTRPLLIQTLNTNWGEVLSMQWCPSRRRPQSRPGSASGRSEHISLGLLAVIYTDGSLRVHDIDVPDLASPLIPQHLEVLKPAFTSHPPRSVHTALCFLTTSHIAAGSANGYLSIYDISIPSSSPRPILHHPVQQSYITHLVSPSHTHPSHIVSSSVSGYISLTQLPTNLTSCSPPAPSVATVSHPRTRTPVTCMISHRQTTSVIIAEEAAATPLRLLSLRRFESSISVLSPRSGVRGVSSLSSSPFHASTLLGERSGRVGVLNPLRRTGRGRNPYMINVEWAGKGVTVGIAWWFAFQHALPTKSGKRVARFLDGLSPVGRSEEGTESGNLSFDGGAAPTTRFTAASTVYPEEIAVTALDWNPNLRCGGWAAAALGKVGLVRVEDLSLG